MRYRGAAGPATNNIQQRTVKIALSKQRQERLLDLLIRCCDMSGSRWLAGISGVHRQRIDKATAVDHIESQVVTHFAAHPLEGALLTREAKILQKYHFRQKIQSLRKTLADGGTTDASAEHYRELVNYFRDHYRALSALDEPQAIASYLARYYARDMIAEYSPAFFRLFRQVTNVIFRNFARSIRVEESEATFARLRPLLGNEPVFYVPNHVSNADHIPICLAINNAGQSQPLIAAGANLYRGASAKIMPLVNAYKIRREHIGGGNGLLQIKWFQNPIYRRVHSEYLRHAWDQNEPCLFYIEGTRSRTGVIGEPKVGILNEVQRYLQDTGRRAHFVPVSLSYSIVPEDVEIEAARQGKEISKMDLVMQLMELDRGFGEHRDAPIHLRFGDPVTATSEMNPKAFAESLVEQIKTGMIPSCTSLLATGIEATCRGKSQPEFKPKRVRKYLASRQLDHNDPSGFDTALEIFEAKGFVAPVEGTSRYRVTNPDLIRQYANRLR